MIEKMRAWGMFVKYQSKVGLIYKLIIDTRAVFLNQFVAAHKCAVRSVHVCRKTFFGPHFYYSFVENEEILVAISKIKLFFRSYSKNICNKCAAKFFFWCLVCRQVKKVENHCTRGFFRSVWRTANKFAKKWANLCMKFSVIIELVKLNNKFFVHQRLFAWQNKFGETDPRWEGPLSLQGNNFNRCFVYFETPLRVTQYYLPYPNPECLTVWNS